MDKTPLSWYHRALGYLILVAFFRPAKWLVFRQVDTIPKGCAAAVISVAFWCLVPATIVALCKLIRYALPM